jgi:hypothetical protein
MSAAVTIPAELVPLVRSAGWRELYRAVEELHTLVEGLEVKAAGSRKRPVRAFARVERVQALLDRLRWTDAREEEAVEIDLYLYHPALRAALMGQLDADGGYLETTKESEPGRPAAADRVEAVRGLLEEIGDVAPDAVGLREGEELVMFTLLPGEQEPDEGEARWWTVTALEKELEDCDPEDIRYALDGLVVESVAERDGERVRVSRCARHMQRMGVICI